jgi:hypothetical protein
MNKKFIFPENMQRLIAEIFLKQPPQKDAVR